VDVAVVATTAHAIVALKPAGVPCEMPRDPGADSLVGRLAAAGHERLRLVHRLDAVACGLVLLATTRQAAAHYAAEIEARRWHKLYVARLAFPARTSEALVGPHKAYLKTVGPRAAVVRAGGKPSFLDVLAAAPAPGTRQQSHVLIRLHTGRFHQIRAMLAHLGAPLAGDVAYGAAAGPIYLEHVVLGACADGAGEWTVWTAPAHRDRDPWAPGLASAVAAAAATARRTPPPRAPAP
jgi:23S rRNA-/tRNA-specific pseudouridylate synthase